MSNFGNFGSKISFGPKDDSQKKSLRSSTKPSTSKIPGLTARAISGPRTSLTKTMLKNGSRIPGLTRNARNPKGIQPKSDGEPLKSRAALPSIAESTPLNIPQQFGLIKSNFIQLQEKKEARTPLPEEETAQESKSSVAAQLKKLLYRVCEKPEDKYLLLKKRDDLLSKARVQSYDINASNVITGTLKELCPEKERYSRLMQGTESYYECDAGVFNPDKAVKEYSRSAADQELPLPHEMRPIDTLELTMDFLMQEVADDVCSNSSELLRWFDFLWNRTRAIRKDITQQQLVSERVVGLIEKCARFHIFAGYRLAPLSPQFDQRLNIENLNKCLLSLRHCYDDLARKNIICQNEAEFRSYDILLNLCDSNVFNQSCQYRDDIQNHKLVKNALEIALSYHTDNLSRFFKLVDAEETTFLQACLAYNHFQAFRAQLLVQASTAFSSDNILSYLTSYFAFDNDKDCLDFLTFHGCTIKESRPERTLISLTGARPKSELKDSPDPIIARKLKTSISEMIYQGIPPKVKPPKATNSFDSQSRYVNDPILNAFLQEAGEEAEAPPSSTEKPLFSGFGNFVNKNLFQPGYSKDPKEAVPVARFAQPETLSKPFAFGNASLFKPPAAAEPKTSTLTSPSLLSVPNTFLPPKAASPPTSVFPTPPKVPELPKPLEPPQPPPGPTKEQIEAEKRRVAEEERKRKEAETLKIAKLAENVATTLVNDMITQNVEKLASKNSAIAFKKVKELRKERKRLVQLSAHFLFRDIVHQTLRVIADKAHDEYRQHWMRLEVIKNRLHELRLNARCRRYIAIWKWAAKRKRTQRAIDDFATRLANRSDEKITGIAKKVKHVVGAPLGETDAMKLKKIRDQKLLSKYFALWKNAVAVRRAIKEEKRLKFTPNAYDVPNLYRVREEQNKKLMDGIMFPNRKRLSTSNPQPPTQKRFFTSTPFRGAPLQQENFLASSISPVLRMGSPLSSLSRHDNTMNGTMNMLDLTEIDNLLESTQRTTAEIDERFSDLLKDYVRH